MIGIKLEKGWKFAKYEKGGKINSIAQTKVIKGDTQILMNSLTLHQGFQIKFDRNTPKKYDSIIMKFKKYVEALNKYLNDNPETGDLEAIYLQNDDYSHFCVIDDLDMLDSVTYKDHEVYGWNSIPELGEVVLDKVKNAITITN